MVRHQVVWRVGFTTGSRIASTNYITRHTQRKLSSFSEAKIAATKKWFETVVVGEKLCPFALPLLKQPELLRIVSLKSSLPNEAIVKNVQNEVNLLMDDSSRQETTLVVMDAPFLQHFLDFVRFSWTLQTDAIPEEYQNKLQLVLFHPHATHDTYASNHVPPNPSDYTTRSPYPTIHLLREQDVMSAVQSGYPNLEQLPARNKRKLQEQGIEACQERLQRCFDAKQ